MTLAELNAAFEPLGYQITRNFIDARKQRHPYARVPAPDSGGGPTIPLTSLAHAEQHLNHVRMIRTWLEG